MEIKINLLVENDEQKIYATNSKFIKVIFEKKEEAAKVVIANNIFHVLYGVESDEEIEIRLNEDIIDIMIKAGAILGNTLYNNTKNEK